MSIRSADRSRGLGVGIASILMAGTALAGGVVGDGSPESCTFAALQAALVGGGLVTFDCTGSVVILIESELVIPTGDDVVIENQSVTLDGGSASRHFVVEPGATLRLETMDLAQGRGSHGGSILNRGNLILNASRVMWSSTRGAGGTGNGGAIYNDVGASLTAVDSQLSGHTAAGDGGAVFNAGTASLLRTYTDSNEADGNGGVIDNSGGSLEITTSTISGQSFGHGGGIHQSGGGTLILRRTLVGGGASGDGGGLYNASGSAEIENVSFFGSQAPRGGGIYSAGTTTLRNVTFHQCLADEGGALYIAGGSTSAVNTIFGDSYPYAGVGFPDECAGQPLGSTGHNLADDASCNLVAAGDLPNTSPLVAIDNSGYWNLTLIPAPGSLAIDAGDDSTCPATDQRISLARPQDGGTGQARCDIGAWEAIPEPGLGAGLAAGILLVAWRSPGERCGRGGRRRHPDCDRPS